MNICWTRPTESNLIMPGIILMGVLCLSGIWLEISDETIQAGYLTLFAIFYIPLLFPAFISTREYRISTVGLTLIYPFGIQKHYPWSEIKEVALCKVHYTAKYNAHDLAIRCAMAEEQMAPKNTSSAHGEWTSRFYEIRHFSKLVSIYYTPERYEEFLANCPLQIKDYRSMSDRVR